MATYSTDFSEYTLNVNLSDWTNYWGAAGFTYQAKNNTGTYKLGTKWCYFDVSGASRKVLTWDDVGSVSDVDILTKIRMDGLSNEGAKIYCRVSGASGSENGYIAAFSGGIDTISIRKYVAGAETNLKNIAAFTQYSTNALLWMRFRVVGTSLKLRIWEEDSVEPNDWLLETTDASLATGAVGIGSYEINQDFYCDYFSCAVSDIVTYPPAEFRYNDEFRNYQSRDNTSYANYGLIQGGQFIDASRKLRGVGVYCADHSDDIRVAVYSGGTLSDPSGATLLKDFGKTSGVGIGWVTIFSAEDIDIPQNDPVWFAIKGNNVAGYGTKRSDINAKGHAGCFQVSRGRGIVTGDIGFDPDVIFAATFPASVPVFANYWYDFRIYLDGHLDSSDLVTFTDVYNLTGQDATLARIAFAQWEDSSNVNWADSSDVDWQKASVAKVLSPDTGSYLLSGANAELTTNKGLTLTAGSFLLSGQNAELTADTELILAAGSYLLAGQNANLIYDKEIIVTTGSFTLTGQNTSLIASKILTVATDSYLLTGQNAGVNRWRDVVLNTDSFTYAGQSVDLDRDLILGTTTDSYLLTGATAVFIHHYLYLLTCTSGLYSFSGNNLTLTRGLVLDAATDSYALTGQSADLDTTRVLGLTAGSYLLTGQNASLLPEIILDVDVGSYSLAGQTLTLTRGMSLDQAVGSYILAGQNAGLHRNYTVDLTTDSYLLTGQNANIAETNVLKAATESFVLTGQNVTLLHKASIEPIVGSFLLTGANADLVRSGLEVICTTDSFLLTGQTVNFYRECRVGCAVGTFNLTGQNVELEAGLEVQLTSGSYLLTGQNVSLDVTHELVCTSGSYLLTGQLVALSQGDSLAVATGAYNLTGQIVTLGWVHRLTPDVGTFLYSGSNVTLDNFYPLSVLKGEFDLTGFNANIDRGTTLTLTVGSYLLTGNTVIIPEDHVMPTESGVFTVTGNDVALLDYNELLALAVEFKHSVTTTNFEHSGFWAE